MDQGLMDMDMGGMPFGEIMNQAVKLKTHQAKPDRCKWDAWPKFKQNTMFTKDDVEVGRTILYIRMTFLNCFIVFVCVCLTIQAARAHVNFEDRLTAAYELKGIADTMFRNKQYLDAAYKYEHATGVFRWLTNKVRSTNHTIL